MGPGMSVREILVYTEVASLATPATQLIQRINRAFVETKQ